MRINLAILARLHLKHDQPVRDKLPEQSFDVDYMSSFDAGGCDPGDGSMAVDCAGPGTGHWA
jgi:hypothetical protein